MLKALELHGFKSFADKTRFEFPPGITVVVGPNGSGKSNIVDGMKWVLGEQSAKSLRGKEMADVIFKGSGGQSGIRKQANTAEVSIFFDNSSGLLAVDTEEVKVTRRVYRSGESEYLINGNPCRLRDVRDTFRGTGMGTDAYSLIEQGKVDTLLQATPRDRRAIFEEAAGISRFKAKKVETQRRLERVEQNLERLSDIVDEVESQLRSVRNQASKARRYKEFTDRLKSLRTYVGLADWRRLTDDLQQVESELAESKRQVDQINGDVATYEQQRNEADERLGDLETRLRAAESAGGNARQQLTEYQATGRAQHQRLLELDSEIAQLRQQSRLRSHRAGELDVQLVRLQVEVGDAEREEQAAHAALLTLQHELQRTEQQLEKNQRQRDDRRQEHAHQLRISSDLSRRIGMLESELQSAQQQREQLEQRLHSVQTQQQDAVRALEQAQATESQLQAEEDAARAQLGEAKNGLHADEQKLNQHQQQAVDLQRRVAVAMERASVLQDLERRNEGLSPGVQALLKRANDTPLGALGSVRGMVADLIRVDVRMAPLIDTALGELTQHVVVEGTDLINEIAAESIVLSGRVGLLSLHDPSERHGAHRPRDVAIEQDAAVLGRADRFVEAGPEFAALIDRLLGTTWCVESLQDALRLRTKVGRDSLAQFVTQRGELLTHDGRLLAGPRQAALGLVSRRSELRSLRIEIAELEPKMQETDKAITDLKTHIAASAQAVGQLTTDYEATASTLINARLATRSASDRCTALCQQVELFEADLNELSVKNESANIQRLQQATKLDEISALVATIEVTLEQEIEQVSNLEVTRQTQLDAVTETKVRLAKREQTLDSLRGQLIRLQDEQQERVRARDEAAHQLLQTSRRRRETEMTILQANTALAQLWLHVERQESELQSFNWQRAELTAARNVAHQHWDAARKKQHAFEQQRHTLELKANQSRMERDVLVERVRDDYDIDLANLEEVPVESEDERLEREEIDLEINEIRKRLSNIGAVNMAALEEIEALDARHQSLATQYQDLVDAKDSLARIIHRINADSRRLFTESLEAIRANFQALFRRVFGGGHADIVLEEGVDILDAGIDIIATPPGKQSLGISLLSGGERALTAVTLLLAIFQYRPSPFCVLDEVDGPLDEANIGRFVDVLHEFLQWTKFVVVTHSKKTMTAANTLYGVTMQESGISKRVSVQFEDVSEDGHIRREA